MTDLKKLLKQGFLINSGKPHIMDLALISLKVALTSYFSTYRNFGRQLRVLNDIHGATQEEIEHNHPTSYFEASSECIVHFQHFAELVCKSFLRAEHPMLADNVLKNPDILHNLINKTPLTDEQTSKLQSVEFSEALNRLKKLVESKKIGDHANLAFITKHSAALEELNNLRNRIWHRGLFILEYRTLDKFIGTYILPFVRDTMAHPSYSGQEISWKYKSLKCTIDPIDEIINHFANEKYDVGKVAFLKELGRAAYNNKLFFAPLAKTMLTSLTEIMNRKKIKRAERIAAGEAESEHNEVVDCPICGVKSLIIEEDTNFDENPSTGEAINAWRFTYSVICENCSFSIGDEIENASKYKLTKIPDYFRYEKL